MRTRLSWRLNLLAGALVVLDSCVPSPSSSPKQIVLLPLGREILIGIPLALSGPTSVEGGLDRQGYELWASWVNDTLGGLVAGGTRHRVRLLVRDDASRPEQSAAVAEQLISVDRVDFLLGPYGNAAVDAVAQVAQRHRVPMVHTAETVPIETGFSFVFGVSSSDPSEYLARIVTMATTLRPQPSTFALIWADDPFSSARASTAKTTALANNLNLVFERKYSSDSTDIDSLVSEVQAAKPDVVLHAGSAADAIAVGAALRTTNFNPKLIAYSLGPSTTDWIPALGFDGDDAVSVSQWVPGLTYKPNYYLSDREFVATYRRQYKTIDLPSSQVAEATAAGLALGRAIQDANTLDPGRVRNALLDVDITTFFGPIRFDSRGANTDKPLVVLQIQDSMAIPVFPPELASAKPIYPTPPWDRRP